MRIRQADLEELEEAAFGRVEKPEDDQELTDELVEAVEAGGPKEDEEDDDFILL